MRCPKCSQDKKSKKMELSMEDNDINVLYVGVITQEIN